MSSSRAPAALDALLAALSSTSTLAGVPVRDGPELSGDYQDGIFVGYDGHPLGEGESILTDQEWVGLGAKRRTERIDLTCAIVVMNGDGTPKVTRDRAYAILAIVETALRTDPSLAQNPTPFLAAITTTRFLWEWVETAGLQGRLVFTVHIDTRT